MKILKLFLSCAAVLVSVTACDLDPVVRQGNTDNIPDDGALATSSAVLRSSVTAHNNASFVFTESETKTRTDGVFIQLTQPASSKLDITVTADIDLVDTFNEEHGFELPPFPTANVTIASSGVLSIGAGERESGKLDVTFRAGDLEPGLYLLPVTVSSSNVNFQSDSKTIYYGIRVRARDMGDYEMDYEYLHVAYLNTSKYQPLLGDKLLYSKLDFMVFEFTDRTFGYMINLRFNTVGYDADSGRALFNPSADMLYVLNNADKYIRPMQDKGRKVCISIEGGATGLGFCNLTDSQIADLVSQIKFTVEKYDIDGVNLFDRNSGYGKAGMPAMNTTSYPKLIKALREAMPNRILTVTDYEAPTEYFWDTAATGGIAVGDYIDYAWSGYMSEDEPIQLLDPYQTITDPTPFYDEGLTVPTSDHDRKPIAGLDKEKFGHFAVPFYAQSNEYLWDEKWNNLMVWRTAGYCPNNIIVWADLISNSQDEYEGSGSTIFGQLPIYFFPDNIDWSAMYSFSLIGEEEWAMAQYASSAYGYMAKDW